MLYNIIQGAYERKWLEDVVEDDKKFLEAERQDRKNIN